MLKRQRASRISSNNCVGPRILESKKGGKLSIHYNGDLSNAEFLLRSIISVNQLSVYGAISDWCGELAQQTSDPAFPAQGNLLRSHSKRFENLPEDMKGIQAGETVGMRLRDDPRS